MEWNPRPAHDQEVDVATISYNLMLMDLTIQASLRFGWQLRKTSRTQPIMADETNEFTDRLISPELLPSSNKPVSDHDSSSPGGTACPTIEVLNYILSSDKIENGLAEHVARCPKCQLTLDRLSGESPLNDLRNRIDPSGIVATWLEPITSGAGLGTLAGFRIESQIAIGGMGVVYRGHDRRLGRKVAIKVLSRFDHPEAADRFLRETRAVAKLQHDHIVPVYESGLARDGRPYLVMPLIEGETLAKRIRREPLEPRKSAVFIRQIALALQAVHDAGLIHRDVKPANILLDAANGRARLTDFGLVRLIGEDAITSTEALVGTPEYMSPEQAGGHENVDHRSDIFNLGVNLYECLTGTIPFQGAPHAVVKLTQESLSTPPRKLNSQIPRDLESICLKAMSHHPSQRYQDGNEFAADLQRYLDELPTIARPVSIWNRSWRWMKRNPRLATLTLALAITLSTLFFGALISSVIFSRQNQLLVERQREADHARLQRIIVASPSLLPVILDSGELTQDFAVSFLREVVSSKSHEYQSRINAAVALSEIGQPQTALLVEAVTSASQQPEQCRNLIRGLSHDKESRTALKARFEKADSHRDRARIALVAFHLEESGPIEQVSGQNVQPETRTTLIHLMPEFHGSIDEIVEGLNGGLSENVKYVFCMSLCLFDTDEFSSTTAKQVVAALERLLDDTEDSGVRAAAFLAIRHWGGTPSRHRGRDSADTAWREYSPGLRLVRIPASTNILGRTAEGTTHDDHQPHEVRLTRDYWIADCEVSIDQFQEFLDDPEYPKEAKPLPHKRREPDSPPGLEGIQVGSHPVQRVSWYDAAQFCNWLSKRHGKTEYYKFRPGSTEESDQGSAPKERIQYASEWIVSYEPSANGFRLPTMAQWEMASRAGSRTDFFFGNDFTLFDKYGRFSSARLIPKVPCGSLLPNRYGLHETLGNVWEWCQNWHQVIGREPVVDPVGAEEPDPNLFGKTFVGGGVQSSSGEPISGSRGYAHPDSRFGNLGFRVSLPQ